MDNLPSISAVKPSSKRQLNANEASIFSECLNIQFDPILCNKVVPVSNQLGIFYIDGVLTKNECELLCEKIISHHDLKFWNPSGRHENLTSFRDADTIEVVEYYRYSSLININLLSIQQIDGLHIAQEIWQRLPLLPSSLSFEINNEPNDCRYERELVGKWEAVGLNSDLLFAKYSANGSFAPHTDGRAIKNFNCRSFYSVIIFLTDIPLNCGGGTRFYDHSAVDQLELRLVEDKSKSHWTSNESLVLAEVESVAGRLLFFDQALVHEGVRVQPSQTKIIIRSDIIFQRFPAICNESNDIEAYALYRAAEDLAEAGNVPESIRLFSKALKMSPTMARIMGQA
eukprot:gene12467-16721_t